MRTLGFDWLLMFMEEHIHSSTVTAALLILVVLLSNQSILSRFKEGLSGGGWLDHTDSVLTNKIGTVLGETYVIIFTNYIDVKKQLSLSNNDIL